MTKLELLEKLKELEDKRHDIEMEIIKYESLLDEVEKAEELENFKKRIENIMKRHGFEG